MQENVIDKVIPKFKTFKYGSEEIKVKQFKLRHIPKVAKLFKSVMAKIDGKAGDNAMTLAVLDLLSTDFDMIMEAVTISTGLKIDKLEEIEENEPDKFAEILKAVIEVNKGFLERMTGLLQG